MNDKTHEPSGERSETLDAQDDGAVDVLEHAEQDKDLPHAKRYRVRIDGQHVVVDTQHPSGELLLSKVGKRPCAYELIAEFCHHDNQVIEPNETIDLRARRLRGFITAHKEIVAIFIDGGPHSIERGSRTVAEILAKVGKTPEAYILLEEKDGPPLPLSPSVPVHIHGCEIFHTQVQGGGSS